MKKKKAFTLVELLVVIAILAILATVSIVGYTSFIKKGKLSNDETLVTQWNTLLNGQEILEDKKYTTASQARALFLANGSTIDDFTPTTDGYHFHWNKEDNRVYLVDDTTNKSTYPKTKDFGNDFSNFNTNYLTFTAVEAGSTVTPKFKSGSWEYYDVSQNKWVEGNNNGTTTITLANIGDKVMLRGSNCITYEEYMFSMTGKIAASGSVTSLTDGVGINPNVTLSDYCYYRMFYNCTSLTTAPELPAMTLANYCYYYMFGYCSALTTAPELPATTLANKCYYQMFQSCTSLTTAPELPATTLANNCYQSMFNGCSALTTAPELPATTLKESCYEWMFCGCSSLTTVPELPATTLAKQCYYYMFEGCTSLTIAPALPAMTLAESCYFRMFCDCSALTTAPELPATTLKEGCYNNMFGFCTSLTTAPELPATTLEKSCYASMFYKCSSLKVQEASGSVPANGVKIFTCPDGTISNCVGSMFALTGGTFTTGTPANTKTYYWYK